MNATRFKIETEPGAKSLSRPKQKRSWINAAAKTLPIRFDWWLKNYEPRIRH
jgi:hypothetical protein